MRKLIKEHCQLMSFEFALFNPSLQTLVLVKATIELSPTGAMYSSLRIEDNNVPGYDTASDCVRCAVEAVLVIAWLVAVSIAILY